jgi:hypothetical protein
LHATQNKPPITNTTHGQPSARKTSTDTTNVPTTFSDPESRLIDLPPQHPGQTTHQPSAQKTNPRPRVKRPTHT